MAAHGRPAKAGAQRRSVVPQSGPWPAGRRAALGLGHRSRFRISHPRRLAARVVARLGWPRPRHRGAGILDLLVAPGQPRGSVPMAVSRGASPRPVPRHQHGRALSFRRSGAVGAGAGRRDRAAGPAAGLGRGVRGADPGGGAVPPLEPRPAGPDRTTALVAGNHALDPLGPPPRGAPGHRFQLWHRVQLLGPAVRHPQPDAAHARHGNRGRGAGRGTVPPPAHPPLPPPRAGAAHRRPDHHTRE